VIITVILRLIFLRPTLKMTEMQKKQTALQGKLKEIKERHKGDKQAEQKATMELYKEAGVNPLSSCLPMVVQIVVLIGFYGVFRKYGFGSIRTDILYSFTPHPTTLNNFFAGYDLTQTVQQLTKLGGVSGYLAFLFPAVAGGTQLIQSLQMRATQPKPDPNAKSGAFQQALSSQMTFLFPLLTIWISYTLSSALSIYWITQTVFMVVQQWAVMKYYQPKITQAEVKRLEAAADTPDIKKHKGGVETEVRRKQ